MTAPVQTHRARFTATELRDRRGRWAVDELLGLPATVGVDVADSVIGVAEDKGREMRRAGTYPVPVLTFGSRYVVPSRPLLALLGIGGNGVA